MCMCAVHTSVPLTSTSVTTLRPIQIRLSAAHLRLLKRLSAKTGLDRTNVIRLAITRLAESEGLFTLPDVRGGDKDRDA
jgi:hypothetical protein